MLQGIGDGMKKSINIICIVSIIVLVIVIIFGIISEVNGDLRSKFLFRCMFIIFLPFAHPALSGLWLINKRIQWKPKTWLIVYLITSGILFVIATTIGNAFEHMADLPSAIREDYSEATVMFVRRIDTSVESKIIAVGRELHIKEGHFDLLEANTEYTIYYLPHIKWVMDIVDENGASLLKERR